MYILSPIRKSLFLRDGVNHQTTSFYDKFAVEFSKFPFLLLIVSSYGKQ